MLRGDPVVALSDLLLNPLVEPVADDGVDHIGKPGPRDLRQVSLFWEVLVELGVVGPDVEQVLGGKPVVVGQIDHLASGLFDNYGRISVFKDTYTSCGPSPGP